MIKPPLDQVEIYGLQESSTDWIPEWRLERTKPLKSKNQDGPGFYLEREAFQGILKDALLWSQQSLRIYLVTGPPGVGKSEFTLWLAGQLKMPVYRLCLSSNRLSDDRLAQLLSHRALKYDAVLLQVDEFQQTLLRWERERKTGIADASGRVTAAGFCEILQGSSTVSRGVVVLSGTDEISSMCSTTKFHALYRRLSRPPTADGLRELSGVSEPRKRAARTGWL